MVGFQLLVSLTLSAGLMVLTDFLTAQIPLPAALITLGNEVLFFLVFTDLVVLFGAELTAVYSSRYHRQPVKPESGATGAGAGTGREVA